MQLKSDNELIQDIKAGSDAALSVLLNRYSKRLKYFLITSFHLPEEDAEDIIQNAFFKFVKNVNRYNFNYEFSTFIYTLVRREAISIKRFFKKVFYSFDDVRISKSNSLDVNFENKELIQFLMNKLTKKEREIIILREIEDFKYDEISKMLNVKVGTLKSLHSRGIKKLRTIINDLNLNREDFGLDAA